MANKNKKTPQRPAQHQTTQPGRQSKMTPKPKSIDGDYQGSNQLKNKVAIITGGDSGIGRAVAYAFALEGAKVVITYLNEHKDAKATQEAIEAVGGECLAISGDIAQPGFCQKVIKKTLTTFNKIDILINNSAEQHPQDNIEKITIKQFEKTFQTNVYSYFYMIKYALPHLKRNSCIINTTSVTAYRGSAHLVDYSATKGAIVSLTRSLSANLVKKGIRVNAVAPGPIWTPLIPASFKKSDVAKFGSNTPMKRAGEPKEVAPCYVFLASKASSYMTGQVLHPNGGEIING